MSFWFCTVAFVFVCFCKKSRHNSSKREFDPFLFGWAGLLWRTSCSRFRHFIAYCILDGCEASGPPRSATRDAFAFGNLAGEFNQTNDLMPVKNSNVYTSEVLWSFNMGHEHGSFKEMICFENDYVQSLLNVCYGSRWFHIDHFIMSNRSSFKSLNISNRVSASSNLWWLIFQDLFESKELWWQ